MTVAITGATGFIGSALSSKLTALGVKVIPIVRKATGLPGEIISGDLSENSAVNCQKALSGCEAVVHLAARVHVMYEDNADPLQKFRKANVDGTLRLAREAAAAGVRRFVFISSIKVNGETTLLGRPFTADQTPAPSDPYGISKWEAEQQLRRLATETGMEVVIIRSVLVYGPGVKANFLHLMQWLHKGIPLPLGAIHNKRSLVALDNLVDLIITCIDHPKAANQTFLVSDGEDVSTTELLRKMCRVLGRSARLLPIPAWILVMAAAMVGQRAMAQRLCGSLQVDIGKTRELLGWKPTIDVDEGLRQTAAHFLTQAKCRQR